MPNVFIYLLLAISVPAIVLQASFPLSISCFKLDQIFKSWLWYDSAELRKDKKWLLLIAVRW